MKFINQNDVLRQRALKTNIAYAAQLAIFSARLAKQASFLSRNFSSGRSCQPMHFPVTDLPQPHSFDFVIIFPLSSSANSSCYAICSGTDHSLSNYPTLLQFGSRLPTKRRPQCSLLLEFIIQLTLRSDDIVKSNPDGSKTAYNFRLLSDQKFLLTIFHPFQTKIKV